MKVCLFKIVLFIILYYICQQVKTLKEYAKAVEIQ